MLTRIALIPFLKHALSRPVIRADNGTTGAPDGMFEHRFPLHTHTSVMTSSAPSTRFLRFACLIAALLAPVVLSAQEPDSIPRPDSTPVAPPVAPITPPVMADSTVDSTKVDSAPKVVKTKAKKSATATAAPAAARKAPVWPVVAPTPLPGSLLPKRRIVAFYGNPLSRRMGILGELKPDSMLAKLDREVAAWNAADSTTPVKPALHLIAVVAQGSAGPSGKYRLRMADTMIERIAQWAESRNALVFLDIQTGLSTIQEELPPFRKWLERPNFHLGLDPEFAMKRGGLPGKKIGTLDAADINWAIDWLAKIVDEKQLAPKVLVVHRFTRPMLTNSDRIKLDPRVQIVVQMDGWGPPTLKRGSYRNYVYSEPVQFTGFKLFYKNDTKAGHPLMSPTEVLKLNPVPHYIQYQ